MAVSRIESEKDRRQKLANEKGVIRRATFDTEFVSLRGVMSTLKFRISESQMREIEDVLKQIPHFRKETISDIVDAILDDVLRRVTMVNPDFVTPNERAEIKRITSVHLEE